MSHLLTCEKGVKLEPFIFIVLEPQQPSCAAHVVAAHVVCGSCTELTCSMQGLAQAKTAEQTTCRQNFGVQMTDRCSARRLSYTWSFTALHTHCHSTKFWTRIFTCRDCVLQRWSFVVGFTQKPRETNIRSHRKTDDFYSIWGKNLRHQSYLTRNIQSIFINTNSCDATVAKIITLCNGKCSETTTHRE